VGGVRRCGGWCAVATCGDGEAVVWKGVLKNWGNEINGFYFVQFVRGGRVEEVADAFLTFVFDGISSHEIGRVKEGRGK
jgi:hypothetical protein